MVAPSRKRTVATHWSLRDSVKLKISGLPGGTGDGPCAPVSGMVVRETCTPMYWMSPSSPATRYHHWLLTPICTPPVALPLSNDGEPLLARNAALAGSTWNHWGLGVRVILARSDANPPFTPT